MVKKQMVSALVVLALLGLLGACAQGEAPTPTPSSAPAARHPFRVDVRGEDGTVVTLDAHSDGYRPGSTDRAQLVVVNTMDQPWNGRVCLQILEPSPSTAVIPLAEETFELMAGNGFNRDVEFDLPAELAPGTYGLALVIHTPTGPATSVTTVHVGDGEGEAFHGEWPWAVAIDACPTP